jgi:uroporphyrinogen decarboxylase
MHFQKVDHPPFCEFLGYWEEAVNRWYREGLPTWVTVSWSGPSEYLGTGVSGSRSISGVSALTDYFGLEKRERISIDFGPIPRFPRKTLEETERSYVEVDEAGIKRVAMKTGSTIPGFLEHPVKTREDFKKIKKRFNPQDPRRYPKAWSEESIEHYGDISVPVGLVFPGFFGQGRTWMGLKNFLLTFFRDPKLIHEMFDFWTDFLIETMRPVVEAKVLDYAGYWEDMSYKNGPHISPSHFREFMLPYYKRVSDFLRRNGVDVITVDTDGDANLLIPLFLEGGVNCLYPLEVQAGMDAVKLREEYGQKLLLIGNLDKKALIEGEDAIRAELERKLPPLVKEGGYIPSVDHLVPVDVPYRNYLYYLELLKKHLGLE